MGPLCFSVENLWKVTVLNVLVTVYFKFPLSLHYANLPSYFFRASIYIK